MSLMPRKRSLALKQPGRTGDVAVLLNGNAKKVSAKVRRQYERLVPAADLYWSRSLDEAEQNVSRILRAGYGTVFTGGGDGTICHAINAMHNQLETQYPRPAAPKLGILKLGTGNAMAHVVGAHDPVGQLQAVMQGANPKVRRIGLIEEGTRLLPFAGIGWDAAILNDFISLKREYPGRIGRRVFHSLLGYAAAISMKTIPRELFRRNRTIIRVRNLGSAVHVLSNGQQLPIPRGTLLFEGGCTFAGLSMIPCYGYGIKIFPYAGQVDGKMHLRISTMGVLETLWNLPAIWRGEYRSPDLLDFLVDAVEIESDDPVPFQVGGDAQGERQKLSFQLSSRSVDVLDFTQPQLP